MNMDLKDVLHFYLGCEGEAETLMANFEYRMKRQDTLTPTMLAGVHRKSNRFKPHLRQLSDMTEEERKECYQLLLEHTDMKGFDLLTSKNDYFGTLPTNFVVYAYLLKQGFDLWNLINSGQAIDKSTLK